MICSCMQLQKIVDTIWMEMQIVVCHNNTVIINRYSFPGHAY